MLSVTKLNGSTLWNERNLKRPQVIIRRRGLLPRIELQPGPPFIAFLPSFTQARRIFGALFAYLSHNVRLELFSIAGVFFGGYEMMAQPLEHLRAGLTAPPFDEIEYLFETLLSESPWASV
ncbi:hypothetical protein C8R43DRAFT_1129232 [Mycena crocata]|nr:hypothetical protein C8R43DRAFT_1129232 [Mycena crocata]